MDAGIQLAAADVSFVVGDIVSFALLECQQTANPLWFFPPLDILVAVALMFLVLTGRKSVVSSVAMVVTVSHGMEKVEVLMR